jgi:hypothetical protein
MSLRAPISHHLDLYRHWLAKRGSRSMPARSDLNPGDICPLLPYLTIVDKVDGQFRWRLVGTAAVQEFGHDPTGGFVGSYLTEPESAAAARAIYERRCRSWWWLSSRPIRAHLASTPIRSTCFADFMQ